MRRAPLIAIALGIATVTAAAQPTATSPDTSRTVVFGGFVDSYYAYDFGRPTSLDRSFASGNLFTTQPARHNEFDINLAYIEAVLSGTRIRGRLALQAGTSVQSNYSGEPTSGAISGPGLARHIQEAFAGYQVTPSLWLDAGIFYSHMGLESWASKDNPTYTRSLIAEYSPYYSSGVRATWQAGPRLVVRADVVNGWQNISETNSDKGAGVRLDFTATPATTLTYYNFLNGETGGRLRFFHGVGARMVISERTTLLGAVDYGTIERSNGDGNATWYGFSAIGRFQLSPTTAVAARVERYDDKEQVNIATGAIDPFRANGASLGLDWMPHSKFIWRSEVRGFGADERIFSDRDDAAGSKSSVFVVSSFGLTF